MGVNRERCEKISKYQECCLSLRVDHGEMVELHNLTARDDERRRGTE